MAVQEAPRPTAAGVGAQRRRIWLAVTVVGLLILAAVPLLTERQDLLNLVFLSVCLGQSWNMLGGFAGQVNLGHAAFFGIGSLVARNLWAGQGYPFSLSFAVGGLAAVAFAMVIGGPTFRL